MQVGVQVTQEQALGYAGDLSPAEAWEMLSQELYAQLVDVRTPAEWAYAGFPDLQSIDKAPGLLPWRVPPNMAVNGDFLKALEQNVDRHVPVLFLCRTGGRSAEAAEAATQAGWARCYNISGGFDGPLNSERRRGLVAGWRASGLPWQQE